MRVHETTNGHKIAKPHTSARRNKKQAMGEFVLDSLSGLGRGEDVAEEVAALFPKATWDFAYHEAGLVRGLVSDSARGRLFDGADVFQDSALAELQGEPVRHAARRALNRERMRAQRGQATIGEAREDEVATTGDVADAVHEAERTTLAEAVAVVWQSLTRDQRYRVRESMRGRPETLETVVAGLRHKGHGDALEAML